MTMNTVGDDESVNEAQAPAKESESTVELYEDARGNAPFTKWLEKESAYVEAVVLEAIDKILTPMGMDICSSEWGKPLRNGIYEFRIRQSLHAVKTWGQSEPSVAAPGEDRTVLIRIFLAFHGDKIVLLFQGYDKKKDASKRRQQQELKKAEKHLKDWKSQTSR